MIKAANGGALPDKRIRTVLALLAIATRSPVEFGKFVQEIRRAQDFAGLTQSLKKSQSLEVPDFASQEDRKACLAVLNAVGSAEMLHHLKAQAPIVARFSFCEDDSARELI